MISVNYGKDTYDPQWKDDAGMKGFRVHGQVLSGRRQDSSFNGYGYSTAQVLVEILERCGDDLTRENVMKQATSLKNVVIDLALPGMSINTSPNDYRLNKQLQMMKFDGERWEMFGPIIEDAGPAG